MIWPATWLGAAAGFAFASIPGALLGALLGQVLDRQLRLPSWGALREQLGGSGALTGEQLRFVMLGRLAKCNGRVKPAHIQQARDEMRRLGLDEAASRRAIAAFNRGKEGDDGLRRALGRLREQRGEAQSLLLSCWRLLFAAGAVSDGERELLLQWGKWLGWSVSQVEALTLGMGPQTPRKPATTGDSAYRDALTLLGVSPGSDSATIKKAYRRLLSRHHPDKRAGAGDDEAKVRAATEKTRQLRSAYALIRERHGFR